MNSKLFPATIAAICGTLAWAMGAKVNVMTGYFAGVIGMGVGFYLGRRFMNAYFD